MPIFTASAWPFTARRPETVAITLNVGGSLAGFVSGGLRRAALRVGHKVFFERFAVDLEFAAAGTQKTRRATAVLRRPRFRNTAPILPCFRFRLQPFSKNGIDFGRRNALAPRT